MEYVRTQAQVEEVAARLAEAALVAADTEAAGYHRYFDRVCLVQLATRTATYVVDTLAVHDISALAPIFAAPGQELVFHDADYDLRLLHRDFGIVVRGLFDTKLAAQFLGEPAIGLASLLQKHLGVHVDKRHQRADWARRPLPADLLEYAAEDTKHLPALRDRLRSGLESRGRLAWAEEEFRIAESQRWTPVADGNAYLRLKGTRDLKPRQLAALREVFGWRERTAQGRDVAPFRVLTNDALVELARRMPGDKAALAGVPGLPRTLPGRAGAELVAAILRARRLPEADLPVRPRGGRRPPPDPDFDALVDRLRATRDRAADALGMDRGFLMPRSQLEELARRGPRTLEEMRAIPEMRRWQVEATGEELLAVIRDE